MPQATVPGATTSALRAPASHEGPMQAACEQLPVITGTRPSAFPSFGDPDDFRAWYRNDNPCATVRLPRRRGIPLPPGDVAIG